MLDPQAKALIDLVIKMGIPPTHTLTPAEARAFYKDRRGFSQPDAPEVASVRDVQVPGPGGPITVRCYRPAGSAEADILPALVYYHGGGHVIGDLETHDVICRQLGNLAGCAVFAVDYRLAPEHTRQRRYTSIPHALPSAATAPAGNWPQWSAWRYAMRGRFPRCFSC